MEKELKIIQLVKAIEHLKRSLPFLDVEDSLEVKRMLSSYAERIEAYNKENATIINPTKAELGVVKVAFASTVGRTYFKPIKDAISQFMKDDLDDDAFLSENGWGHIKDYDDWTDEMQEKAQACQDEINRHNQPYNALIDEWQNEFQEAMSKTNLSDKIVTAKIIMKRRVKDYYNMDAAEREMNAFLLEQMRNEFVEQNTEFMKKVNSFNPKKL
jgi:hypothetical protein